jgi:hypothetical protein
MKAYIQTLQETYKTLERDVNSLLKLVITNSILKSKHVDSNCIKVDVYDYTELVIIDTELVFLDDNGYHYRLYSECSLEDLIDILNKID